nr:hypothetical protein [Achromobacter ruhlandii]
MKPSDNEIEMLAAGFAIHHKNGLIRFAHALLDKYAPQASAQDVRNAALEACRLVVERFGPTEQDYIFSKRMAIQKCRAVHAAAQAEQGERQWAS